MRILLVEDHLGVAEMVLDGLSASGYSVEHISRGDEGLHLARTGDYDLLILDVMLPGLDGLTLLKTLRAEGCSLPILLLTAKSSLHDRVQGLDGGADDYVTKPFAFSELEARVRALIRRSSRQEPSDRQVLGELILNLSQRSVTREGREVPLLNKEFELLHYLMTHPNQIVSKDMIIRNVWKYNFDPGTNIVEVRISALREKMDKPFKSKMIHTIRGAGYMLRTE